VRVSLQRNRNGKQDEEECPESTHGLTLACTDLSCKPGLIHAHGALGQNK
jgi:hypothetical protein